MTKLDLANHHNAWDQIPWLINGTLDPDEASAIKAHIATCAECSAEFERQQRLTAALTAVEPPMPSQAYALEEISHRLTTQKPAVGVFGQLGALMGRLTSPSLQGLAIGGALAATVLFVLMTTIPQEPKFETLTSPTAATDGVEIRLRFQTDIDPTTIRDLMAKAGATDISGPSETGLMRGIVSGDSAASIVETLKSDPRVVFVSRDQ